MSAERQPASTPPAELLARFADAWRRGERPGLDEHLPSGGEERRPALLDLVRADLQFRLQAGEAARVEAYLGRYPELGEDPSVVLTLLAAEYQARAPREEGLSLEEYGRRFPALLEEMQRQWATLPTHAGRSTSLGEALPPPSAPAAGTLAVAGYEVLGVLGRGAMGIVYKARQKSLKRLVALKMIRSEADHAPELLARFQAEAEAIARLQHANIVQIYEVGQHASESGTVCPYMALELVEGGTLAHQVRGRPLPPPAGGRAARHPGPGGPGGPPAGRRPPRPQAGQRPVDRRRDAQDRRLRPGQAPQRGRRPDPGRAGARHAQLHGSPSRPPAEAATSARRWTPTPWGPSCTSCSPAGPPSPPPRWP
jgi:hypothetical protein